MLNEAELEMPSKSCMHLKNNLPVDQCVKVKLVSSRVSCTNSLTFVIYVLTLYLGMLRDPKVRKDHKVNQGNKAEM